MDVKVSFLVKGALTYVLPRTLYARRSGGTDSARYCYSVFLRHLVRLGRPAVPPRVAELGPGDSIGIGLAALLAGAERYVGLDVVPFAAPEQNLAVFDELVALFQDRAPVPDDSEFPRVRPKLASYGFPSDLLSEATLDRSLAPERIAAIRDDLAAGTGRFVDYVAPWQQADRVRRGEIDWIFSQAVLEHVDDLDGAYRSFADWLAPGGLMSHQIDFKCHNMAAHWNGHWAAGEGTWRLVQGRRPYLLNRQPLSAHLRLLEQTGFEVLEVDRAVRDDGLPRSALRPAYRALSDRDLETAGVFVVARRA